MIPSEKSTSRGAEWHKFELHIIIVSSNEELWVGGNII